MISILIVEDQPVYRNGLSRILKGIPNVSKCSESENGKVAIEALEQQHYDIVLLDLQMPVMDGYKASDIILEKFPQTKIIILSVVDEKKLVLGMLKKGVHGYMLKGADEKEIRRAVQHVFDGNVYLSGDIQKMMNDFVNDKINAQKDGIQKIELSPREKEVIQLICDQFTSAEIATKLNISESTVKNHRANILQKLQTDNIIGIAMYAVRTGLYIPQG